MIVNEIKNDLCDESSSAHEFSPQLANNIIESTLGDLIMETCLGIHRDFHTGVMSIDELYGFPPAIHKEQKQPLNLRASESTKSHANSQSMLVTCPECEQLISGHRFAPHLEKCMRGGKRGTKKTSFTELMLPYSSAPRVKAPVVDPHPSSLIVRIKLRNGVPKANQMRLGATMEEFMESQQIELESSPRTQLDPEKAVHSVSIEGNTTVIIRNSAES